MKKITHIFYDLDGTLRLNVPNGYCAFADGVEELGMPLSAEDRHRAALWEHSYWAESPDLVQDREKFPVSEDFWLNYGYRQLQILGASPEKASGLAPHINKYMREQYKPVDTIPADLPKTLATLKERGYLLGVMSNRFQPYQEYLASRGLGEFFQYNIYAGEAGIRKPNPGVFYYMFEKAGAKAETSLYIGDNYFADVVGARGVGLRAVLFDINGLFTEPDCPVISKHSQIFDYLDGRNLWPGNKN